jgi:hypothetical protein
MHATKSALAAGFAATLLVALSAPSASAHVHGINPLGCHQHDNAAKSGAKQAVEISSSGPIAGTTVIPEVMSGGRALGNHTTSPSTLC